MVAVSHRTHAYPFFPGAFHAQFHRPLRCTGAHAVLPVYGQQRAAVLRDFRDYAYADQLSLYPLHIGGHSHQTVRVQPPHIRVHQALTEILRLLPFHT